MGVPRTYISKKPIKGHNVYSLNNETVVLVEPPPQVVNQFQFLLTPISLLRNAISAN